ncbi:MAG: Sensor histidine kinase YycG [bacterium ADurb.Bin363]|nr:MAG: Sensor histidine kinase YycG [bacterium ADurb.Bin363]
MKLKIQYQLTFTYIFVILLTITITGILFFHWLKNILMTNLESNLQTQAHSIAKMLGGFAWDEKDLYQSAFSFIENFEIKEQFILKIFDKNGKLIVSSEKQYESNSSINKEGRKALYEEHEIKWIEEKNNEKLIHITVPIATWKKIIGLVDVSSSLNQVQHILTVMMRSLELATIWAVLAVSIIGFFIARTVTEPIKKLKNIAVKISQGDFQQKIESVKNPPELEELAVTINYMADQLKNFIDEITNEKNKINAILTNVVDGLIAINMENKITFLNSAAEKKLSLNSREGTGKLIEQIWEKKEIMILIERSKEEKILIQKEINLTPEEIFHFTFAPFQDEKGENPGTIIVFRDITELKRLENMRAEFFSNVSHELRTPLTIIKGFCITLMDDYPPEEALWKHSLKTIEEETDRLTRLVNDMLELAKLRDHKIKFIMNRGDLKKLLLDVIEQFRLQIERYEVKLNYVCPEILPQITFDADRIKQVFINLLDNAIKYTPPEGKITINTYIEEKKLYIKITDTGPGIEEEEIPRLFERFFRGKQPEDRKGTGLGLPIVKEIIEAHRGGIDLKNILPAGLEVIFWLPL